MIKSILKRAVSGVLGNPAVDGLLRGGISGHCAIFMLHRFQCPDRGVVGHDPESLRRTLAALRADGREIIGLREAFRRLAGEGPRPNGAVCFTIDDGYADHAEVAAPVFAEFDAPVTTFVATGFLDRRLWYWWDRVEFAVRSSAVESAVLDLGAEQVTLSLDSCGGREASIARIVSRCKTLAAGGRDDLIQCLASALEVQLPDAAPPAYEPMSWDQLRACERGGMTFAPHTVTHPILRLCTDDESAHEIRDSWSRLEQMAGDPDPVFCYPNGQPTDFGRREFDTITGIGLLGGVSGVETYASREAFQRFADYRFQVPRFPYTERWENMKQILSGFTRVKERIRGVA